MKRPVIVLGGGGHARVLLDALVLLSAQVLGITVRKQEGQGGFINNIPILGEDEKVFDYSPSEILLVNGLGTTNNTNCRRELFTKFKYQGYSFASIIHPKAIIASDVLILEGVQVMAGAVVQTGSRIGMNTIVNTRSSVDHDCLVGDHVHIAPGVTLSGGVFVDNCVHIGTGATVIQGKRIGCNCVIGAGAVVISDIPDNSIAFGVPARIQN